MSDLTSGRRASARRPRRWAPSLGRAAARPPPAPAQPLPHPPLNSPPLVSRFGFENGHTFFDGLWGGGDTALTRHAHTVVWRLSLLGFNAVRVPFSFTALNATARDVTCTCANVTAEEVAASVTPPGRAPPLGGPPPLADGAAPLGPGNGTCNAEVPAHSTRARFLWALKLLARSGERGWERGGVGGRDGPTAHGVGLWGQVSPTPSPSPIP